MAAEKPELNNPIFTAMAAEQCEFNKHLLNKQIRESHFQSINVSYYKSIKNIPTLKREISKYIQYEPNFDQYLDEIMENIVGRKMLRLLIANMKENEPTGLWIGVGAKDEFDGVKITINLDDYNEAGITKRPLCGLDIRGQLIEKYDSIGDTIFHELCHALHKYSERDQNECRFLDKIYEELQVDGIYKVRQEKYLWTDNKSEDPNNYEDDEELYTITGHHYGGFDPINCNMYNICKNANNKWSIIQRMFHADHEQLQQEIRNKTRFDPLYKVSEFLINLDDYIIPKCNEPNQVVDQSEYSALPPLSPHGQPGQAVEPDKPAPLPPLSLSRPPGQAVKPNKPTPATILPQPSKKRLNPQGRHVPTIPQIRGKPKQPQLPSVSKCWPPIVTLVFAKK
jgi:hypothetical protein